MPYKLKHVLLCGKISKYFQVFSKENESICSHKHTYTHVQSYLKKKGKTKNNPNVFPKLVTVTMVAKWQVSIPIISSTLMSCHPSAKKSLYISHLFYWSFGQYEAHGPTFYSMDCNIAFIFVFVWPMRVTHCSL